MCQINVFVNLVFLNLFRIMDFIILIEFLMIEAVDVMGTLVLINFNALHPSLGRLQYHLFKFINHCLIVKGLVLTNLPHVVFVKKTRSFPFLLFITHINFHAFILMANLPRLMAYPPHSSLLVKFFFMEFQS